MYAYIKGKLSYTSPTYVIVEANGIGYQVHVPASLYGHLPSLDANILLYTSFIVREQSQALYGFLSANERDLFEQLLNISGIGPKTSLSLIGHLPAQALCQAIAANDSASICKVPGIGKKTAERLIIEMRDKISELSGIHPSDFAIQLKGDPREQAIRDAMSALINLGYNQVTAQKAIKKTLGEMPDTIDLAQLITTSLQHI
jgi:Holliday junction DNA helicase RuvA